jgi:uncharacterized damage-inducible protein DinB
MSSNIPDRHWPTTFATDEQTLQREFLTFLRITAATKVEGLNRAQGSAAPVPTSPVVTAMGVLKHLTAVERYWISIIAGGSDLPELWGEDADASWKFGPDETPESVVADYQAEWALSDKALEGRGPDEPTAVPDDKTIRWILTHVIQETARHVGHLDFLRELADGAKGE